MTIQSVKIAVLVKYMIHRMISMEAITEKRHHHQDDSSTFTTANYLAQINHKKQW